MTAKEYLHFLLDSLVEETTSIQIEEKNDELGKLLSFRVAPSDMGTIIGRSGKTIDALRTLMRVYGSKSSERVNLRIIEEK